MHSASRVGALSLLFLVYANAQSPVTRAHAALVNRLFDNSAQSESLPCAVEGIKPFLDFAFRFEAGFTVRCPVKDFEGKADVLFTYIRVTPEGGAPVLLLTDSFTIPASPQGSASNIDLRKLRSEFEVSGGFELGEGRYKVEVLAVDSRQRIARKQWTTQVARHMGERNVPMGARDHTVGPIVLRPWSPAPLASANPAKPRLRLTVLLDAAPMNPTSLKLRQWDKMFLLDSLYSLLEQTDAQSVRLVAVNLDQQREFFREERFSRSGFYRLAHALQDLELGTIPYQTVARDKGWTDLLVNLVNQESTAAEPSDAVIVLGPVTRLSDKVSKDLLANVKGNRPEFFNIQFVPAWRRGREWPDSVEYFINACDGTTLKVHSPGELATALSKLKRQLQQSDRITEKVSRREAIGPGIGAVR